MHFCLAFLFLLLLDGVIRPVASFTSENWRFFSPHINKIAQVCVSADESTVFFRHFQFAAADSMPRIRIACTHSSNCVNNIACVSLFNLELRSTPKFTHNKYIRT